MYEWEIILILIFFLARIRKILYHCVRFIKYRFIMNITMRRYNKAIFTNAYKSFYRSSLIFRFIYTGVMTPWPSWPRFDTYHLSVHCNTAFVSSFPLFIKEREKVLRNCSKLNHVQKAEKKHLFPQEEKKGSFSCLSDTNLIWVLRGNFSYTVYRERGK